MLPSTGKITLALLAATLGTPLEAQSRLGTVVFPNSGSPAAQAPFVRGVLLMHSFEYGDAAAAFREAQKADPAFALAYWGEALTYTHPIWNEQDRAAARAVLGRLAPSAEARLAKAPTTREQAYLGAVETLYGAGSKPHRDTLYSAAMARLAETYPDDDEAKAFYALSLLGLSQGDRDLWSYMRAAAVAQQVWAHNRDHPGAVHYIIHSFDDPTHAPLGLPAARAYTTIAPDAAHAQHMTSHIFVAMGMWDDVVAANERAMRVTERRAGRSPVGCRHYNEWLEYGYLQQGRPQEALRLVNECQADTERQRGAPGSLALMRAMYLMDTRQWTGAVAQIQPDSAAMGARLRAVQDLVNGWATAEQGALEPARATVERIAARRATSPSATERGYIEVAERLLRARLAMGDGRADEALELVERAASLEESLPFEFGPPPTPKPPREAKGEFLLSLNRPADAAREFDRSLRRTPKRALALLGLARAAAASGQTDLAVRTYRELAVLWHQAESGYPPLAEAENFLARHVSERP